MDGFTIVRPPPTKGGLAGFTIIKPRPTDDPTVNRGVVGETVRAFKGGVDRLKENSQALYSDVTSRKTAPNLIQGLKDTASDIGRMGAIAGDALSIAASPVTGVTEALAVKPAARALSVVPRYGPDVRTGPVQSRPGERLSRGEGEVAWQGDVRNDLMAVMPAKPRPVSVPTPQARIAGPTLDDTITAFDRARVTPSLAAAKGKGAATVTNAVADNPIAGAPSRARLRRNLDEVSASADRISTGYGSNRGPMIAGENVQAGVKRFSRGRDVTPNSATAPASQSSFSAKSDVLYDRAFEPIQAAEARAVERSARDFEQRAAQASGQQAAATKAQNAAYEAAVSQEMERARLLKSSGYEPREIPKPGAVAKPDVTAQRPAVAPTQTLATLQELSGRVNAPRLSAMITDPRVRSIAGALESDAHNVRFNDLRELRTWVRNAQRDPTLRQGMSQAGLQRIESALTGDIYNNAERLAGPEALRRLQRTDAFYAAGSRRINKALQAFDDSNSGEGAFARIQQAAGSTSSADAQKLLSLKRSLSPDEWGDVAATQIKYMGQAAKGAENAADAEAFSINNFVTNYAKMSPRARKIMFGSIGGGGSKATSLADELDNLVSVAGRLKAVEKGANGSKTATSLQSVATVSGLLYPPTSAATAWSLGGFAATGEMMTNPVAVRAIAALAKASRQGSRALSGQMGRLRIQAQTNPILLPVFVEAQRALLAPPIEAATPVAASEERQ